MDKIAGWSSASSSLAEVALLDFRLLVVVCLARSSCLAMVVACFRSFCFGHIGFLRVYLTLEVCLLLFILSWLTKSQVF